MKIQFLNGGLANQAFQYIFARHYELSHPGESMYLDDTYFALNTVHNGYELEKVFGIRAHMLSQCFDDEVWSFILEERRKGKSVPTILCENGIETYMVSDVRNLCQTYNPFTGKIVCVPGDKFIPEIYDEKGDVYYHGYWISKGWFTKYKEEFLREFTFPEIQDELNRAHLQRIYEVPSVSVHIRRGDFVQLGWAYPADIYRGMIDSFVNECGSGWELFVFSDDIPWCRENQEGMGFQKFRKVHFVEGNVKGRNYIDMQLMSQCEAMIMSNSSFCYLAALLNTRKRFFINPSDREV